MLDPKEARKRLRKAIEREFVRLKAEHGGGLERAAQEIGVSRQQLQQWAKGVVVPSDVLLMAFMTWGSTVRLEDGKARESEPAWWEFALSSRDGGFQKRRSKPVQMSLFEALDDLQDDNVEVRIIKKGPGRLELGLEIGFRKIKF